jgi:hypothetical protein
MPECHCPENYSFFKNGDLVPGGNGFEPQSDLELFFAEILIRRNINKMINMNWFYLYAVTRSHDKLTS